MKINVTFLLIYILGMLYVRQNLIIMILLCSYKCSGINDTTRQNLDLDG